MPAKSVFISHATRDDAQVKELRHNLELLDVLVWTDSENLTAGGGRVASVVASGRVVRFTPAPLVP